MLFTNREILENISTRLGEVVKFYDFNLGLIAENIFEDNSKITKLPGRMNNAKMLLVNDYNVFLPSTLNGFCMIGNGEDYLYLADPTLVKSIILRKSHNTFPDLMLSHKIDKAFLFVTSVLGVLNSESKLNELSIEELLIVAKIVDHRHDYKQNTRHVKFRDIAAVLYSYSSLQDNPRLIEQEEIVFKIREHVNYHCTANYPTIANFSFSRNIEYGELFYRKLALVKYLMFNPKLFLKYSLRENDLNQLLD